MWRLAAQKMTQQALSPPLLHPSLHDALPSAPPPLFLPPFFLPFFYLLCRLPVTRVYPGSSSEGLLVGCSPDSCDTITLRGLPDLQVKLVESNPDCFNVCGEDGPPKQGSTYCASSSGTTISTLPAADRSESVLGGVSSP